MLETSWRRFFGLLLLLLFFFAESKGQSPFKGLALLFTEPRHYVTYFAEDAPVIDGNIDGPAWSSVEWTDKFIPIVGGDRTLPPYDTRVKMVWNDAYLFIAAKLEEPHVWATLKNHDDIVFYDNDFEVFIDPDNNVHQYFEIEVNAYNTIFDLFMPKPYRNGGSALINWNINNLRSTVQVQGTSNDPTDIDQSWTVEMAIPFNAVSMGNYTKIPKEGTLWRINFSRVQWDTHVREGKYVKKGADGQPLPEHNWVWSPQGVVNMHYPERWGYLRFSRKNVGKQTENFTLPLAEKQKRYLWLVYYKQKQYYQKHDRYAHALGELGLKGQATVWIDEQENHLGIEATNYQFMAMIQVPGKTGWSIDQDGLIRKFKNR